MVRRLFLTPPDLPDATITRCLTIPASKEWLGIFNAALLQAAASYNYEQVNDTDLDPETVANRCYQVYEAYLREECEVVSCSCEPTLTRWTEDGTLQTSTDGGIEWVDTPLADIRNNAPLFPPLSGADGDVKRCKGAENVVANFQGQIDQYVDQLNLLSDVMEMFTVVAGTVTIFLGTFAPITAFIATLAFELVAEGASAVSAAFDGDVWDRLRCNVYCAMLPDGTVTAAGIAAIHDQIDEDETGVTNILLHQMVDTLGANGLTNMGRTGHGTGEDCGDCECNCDSPTSSMSYLANNGNTAFTIGQYVVDGACDGRKMSGGATTNNVRLIIPDRDGRVVRQVQVFYCDSSGSPLDVDVQVGTIDSDEGTQEAHGAPIYNWATPIDSDQVDISMPTPSQGWLIVHHVVVYYCEGE